MNILFWISSFYIYLLSSDQAHDGLVKPLGRTQGTLVPSGTILLLKRCHPRKIVLYGNKFERVNQDPLEY